MKMWPVFKRRSPAKDRLAAVYSDRQGIAIAAVRRQPGYAPVLELCRYEATDPDTSGRKALGSLVSGHNLRNSRGVGLMALNSYYLFQIDAPEVPVEERAAAARWRIKDLVDYDVEDTVIEVFDAPTQRLAGSQGKLNVVVAERGLVKTRIDAMLGSGLAVETIDIPELALLNIARLLPEDVGGVIMVYIGKDAGIINVSHRGDLYLSRSLQFGTDALPDTAIHAGDEDAIESFLDNIVIEIQRSLDYYDANYSQPPVEGLVIGSTDPDIPDMVDYLRIQTGLQSRMLDINELLDVEETVDSQRQAQCVLAIGAALREEAPRDAPAD